MQGNLVARTREITVQQVRYEIVVAMGVMGVKVMVI
jgi:hypothetical protein